MNINDKVKVLWGRNKGKIGTIKLINKLGYGVSFPGHIYAPDTFLGANGNENRYDDFYWVKKEFVESI